MQCNLPASLEPGTINHTSILLLGFYNAWEIPVFREKGQLITAEGHAFRLEMTTSGNDIGYP